MKKPLEREVRNFKTPAQFRAWLQARHTKSSELYVGYFKRHTGKLSLTWPESVAEALCFGWVDGIRRRIDDDRFTIRFTPRKKGSIWSAVNLRFYKKLEAERRVMPAGRAAYEARTAAKSRVYSYEQKEAGFDAIRLRVFQRAKGAWAYFQTLPPSYRQKATWWVMSAKQEDAKLRRLARLIEACAEGKRLS